MMPETDTAPRRPLPRLEGLTADYYSYLRQHELRLQRCDDCGRWRHVPRSLCSECNSSRFAWARASGHGTVFSWTVTERSMHPAFVDMPIAHVVVTLDEGPRLFTVLADDPPEVLELDLPVVVVFRDVTPEVTLPFVKRAVQ